MNYKNNLELSIYLRSFGIFDTDIISAIEEIPIEKAKIVGSNPNCHSRYQYCSNKSCKLFTSFRKSYDVGVSYCLWKERD